MRSYYFHVQARKRHRHAQLIVSVAHDETSEAGQPGTLARRRHAAGDADKVRFRYATLCLLRSKRLAVMIDIVAKHVGDGEAFHGVSNDGAGPSLGFRSFLECCQYFLQIMPIDFLGKPTACLPTWRDGAQVQDL